MYTVLSTLGKFMAVKCKFFGFIYRISGEGIYKLKYDACRHHNNMLIFTGSTDQRPVKFNYGLD